MEQSRHVEPSLTPMALNRASSCCTSPKPPSALPYLRYSADTPASAMQVYLSKLVLEIWPFAISSENDLSQNCVPAWILNLPYLQQLKPDLVMKGRACMSTDDKMDIGCCRIDTCLHMQHTDMQLDHNKHPDAATTTTLHPIMLLFCLFLQLLPRCAIALMRMYVPLDSIKRG